MKGDKVLSSHLQSNHMDKTDQRQVFLYLFYQTEVKYIQFIKILPFIPVSRCAEQFWLGGHKGLL